jgi:hypothetical protein
MDIAVVRRVRDGCRSRFRSQQCVLRCTPGTDFGAVTAIGTFFQARISRHRPSACHLSCLP